VDADGLCVSCGGQPLAYVKQVAAIGGRPPHRAPDVDIEEGRRIDTIITADCMAEIAEETRNDTDLSPYGYDPDDV
jgi:hypothetical protein